MKLLGGLLHLLQRGGAWATCGAVPNVTAHPSTASVPITVSLYNGPLLCGFNVPIKGLKAETTIFWPVFWPHYPGSAGQLALTVLNHGRATASRQTEKTVDTRHWRVDWLRIHSAKGDVTRSSTMEKKDIGVVVCCRQPSSRKVDEWVSEWLKDFCSRCLQQYSWILMPKMRFSQN